MTLREKADEAIAEALSKQWRVGIEEKRVDNTLLKAVTNQLRDPMDNHNAWVALLGVRNARSEAEEAFQEAVEAERKADQESTQADGDALNVKGIDAYKELPQEEPAG